MSYQAIVHAPCLRPGARLCLSDLAQSEAEVSQPIRAGDIVRMRFGACCPDLATGAVEGVNNDYLVLACRGEEWTLHRASPGGVSLPGLRSQTWFVVERHTAA